MADNIDLLEPTGAAPTGFRKRTNSGKEIGGVLFPQTLTGYFDTVAASFALVTDTAGLPVKPLASEAHLGEVGGNSDQVAIQLARAAADKTYAKGQFIQAATAGQLSLAAARKNAGSGAIAGFRLTKSTPTLTNASFRIYVVRQALVTPPGDGTLISAQNMLAARIVAKADITMDEAYADGAEGIVDLPSARPFRTTAGTLALTAYIVANAAYTSTSGEVFELTSYVYRD